MKTFRIVVAGEIPDGKEPKEVGSQQASAAGLAGALVRRLRAAGVNVTTCTALFSPRSGAHLPEETVDLLNAPEPAPVASEAVPVPITIAPTPSPENSEPAANDPATTAPA